MDKETSLDAPSLRKKELEEITSKISDLDKWRKIFSWHGLEASRTTHQDNSQIKPSQKRNNAVVSRLGKCQDPIPDDDKENTAGATTSPLKQDQFPSNNLNSIPKTLLVSSNQGGQPISREMAVGLRKMLFGSTFQVFSYEWKKAYFRFHKPCADLAYALEIDKSSRLCYNFSENPQNKAEGGAIAIQMAVQVNIIKYLLFVQNKEENIHLQSLCELSQKEQEKALVAALTDILWKAGEGQKATVCLVTSDTYLTPSIDYKVDNFTERVQLFDFFEKEAARKFLCDHIHCAILNIILTGRASPHVFNGIQKVDAEGSVQKLLHGVLSRSDVGYLHWSKDEMENHQLLQVH
uniref:Uncharacterized protein n=1 Tax=Sphaerodactylus townsendi TaxID=933632 RepID=A0ACB8FAQ2_9SAUR